MDNEAGISGLESEIEGFNPTEYEFHAYHDYIRKGVIEEKIPELLRQTRQMGEEDLAKGKDRLLANAVSCIHVGDLYASFIIIPPGARIYIPTISDLIYMIAKKFGDSEHLKPEYKREMEARADGKAMKEEQPEFDEAEFAKRFPFFREFAYKNGLGVWKYMIVQKTKHLNDMRDLFDINAHIIDEQGCLENDLDR